MRTLKLLVLVPFAIAAIAAACGGKKEPVTPSTDTIVGEAGADMPDAAPSADIAAAVDAGSAAVAAIDSGAAAAAVDTALDAGTDAGKKKKKKAGK